jgi:hypothetical protein
MSDSGGEDDTALGSGEAGKSTGTRGLTRSGLDFRKSNRGYYDSLKALAAAHRRIFSDKSTLYLIGERISCTDGYINSIFSHLSQKRDLLSRLTVVSRRPL